MSNGNTLSKILGGDFLKDKKAIRQIPLLLLIMVYALFVVSNRYKVEQLVKEKAASKERIEYLREYRIQMQQQYQETIKISKIEEDLDTLGVGITGGAPIVM